MPKRIKKHAASIYDIAMMAGPMWNTEPGDGGGNTGAAGESGGGVEPEGEKPADKEPDWKSRFEGQQKVNRDQEAKLNTLRDGLKAALGIDDKKATSDELLRAMQKQLDELAKDKAVNDVARRHQITDADDIALLAGLGDEAAMDRLAARLARKGGEQQEAPGKPGTPKPDPSQGRGSGGGVKPTSVAQVMAERAAARANSN